MLLNCTRVCPGCASECIGRLPASMQCNRCLRTIFTTGTTKLSVSGVCTKDHILCQHCVEVNTDQLNCPVCLWFKADLLLREAQRKLFLACYCEEAGTMDLVELKCGHTLELQRSAPVLQSLWKRGTQLLSRKAKRSYDLEIR